MPLLVGRGSSWGEVNAAELKTFLCSLCERHVPAVDGIEGSAKESDVHAHPVTKPAGAVLPLVSLDSQNPEFSRAAKSTG